METDPVRAWIDSAMQAARVTSRVVRNVSKATPRPDFPLPPVARSGLRGLDQTQSLDILRSKGRIIDRYV